MESRRHCAYNHTKKCLICSEVVVGDRLRASLGEQLPGLTPKSYSGLWIVPFTGFPDKGIRVQLDLIYLDEDCRVIGVVESFPTDQASPSTPTASSVLALPTVSISLSQTQLGDQVIVCAAEEMTQRIQSLTSATGNVSAVAETARTSDLFAKAPRFYPDSQLQQPINSSTEQPRKDYRTPEEVSVEPESESVKSSRNWLARWLFPDPPDPRTGQREPPPGLIFQIWAGEVLQTYKIRDISKTGLFVETEQRWYRGTIIRVRLTKMSTEEQPEERSITVQMKAARLANDGVGLQFVPPKDKDLLRGQSSTFEGASSKQFEEFLEWLLTADS